MSRKKTQQAAGTPTFEQSNAVIQMTDVVSAIHEKDSSGKYVPVLSGVTLQMFEGETWGIGADEQKLSTTLTTILANMRPYLSGRVRVGSVGMFKKKRFVLPHIFYFDTEEMLYPNMTVLEELMFCFGSKKKKKAAERQKELLDLLCSLDMGYISLSVVKDLTRAERTLVLLLIAVLTDSKIIIGDIYGLDFSLPEINRIKNIAGLVKEKKKLMILATDLPRLIGIACDHAVYLSHGKMLYAGSTEVLLKSCDNMVCAMTAPEPESFARSLTYIFPGYSVEVDGKNIYLHNRTGNPFVPAEFFRKLSDMNLNPTTIRISVGRIENSFNTLKIAAGFRKEQE